MTSRPISPPPPPPPPPTDLLPALTSTSQLLHLIAHRNRNQHREQRWWKWFGLLRKGVKGVVQGLEQGKVEEREVERAVFGGIRRKQGKGNGKEAVERWRGWLRERADGMIVAFSSLISDQQFSPLGIVLFTILAEVCHKLKIELPSESVEAVTEARAIAGTTVRRQDNVELAKKVPSQELVGNQGEEDIGEVVRRGDPRPEFGVDPEEGLAKAQKQGQTSQAPLRKAQNQSSSSMHTRSTSAVKKSVNKRADLAEEALLHHAPPLSSPTNPQAKPKPKPKALPISSTPIPINISNPLKKKRKMRRPSAPNSQDPESVRGLTNPDKIERGRETSLDDSEKRLEAAATPVKAKQNRTKRMEMKTKTVKARADEEGEGNGENRRQEQIKGKENKKKRKRGKSNAIDELFGTLA